MKLTFELMAIIAFMLSGIVGCGDGTSPSPAGSATADDADVVLGEPGGVDAESPAVDDGKQQPADDQSPEKDVTAEVASWEETQEYIASQKGKVVVLDAWSTSCLPCIKELPNLVALQKRYPKRVVCLTLNLDYYGDKNSPPEASKDDVLQVLRKVKSTMHNVISSTADEEFYEAVNLGSIPAVFVYGLDGKLKKRFDNAELEYGEEGFTYEQHIVPLVEKLLPQE